MFNLLKDFTQDEVTKQTDFDQLVEFTGALATAPQQGQAAQAPQQQTNTAQRIQNVKAILANATDVSNLIANPKVNRAEIENVLAAVMAKTKGSDARAAQQLIQNQLFQIQQGTIPFDQFKNAHLKNLGTFEQQTNAAQAAQDKSQGRLGMKPQLAQQQSHAPQNPTMGNQNAASQMQPTKMM